MHGGLVVGLPSHCRSNVADVAYGGIQGCRGIRRKVLVPALTAQSPNNTIAIGDPVRAIGLESFNNSFVVVGHDNKECARKYKFEWVFWSLNSSRAHNLERLWTRVRVGDRQSISQGVLQDTPFVFTVQVCYFDFRGFTKLARGVPEQRGSIIL